MNMQSMEIIKKQMCKEVDRIAEMIEKNQTMSSQDLDQIDKLFHALKSQKIYCEMVEAEEGWENDGMSGRRGRSATTGRYISRDSGYEDGYSTGYAEGMDQSRMGGNSYADGYSRGYSEAMSRNQGRNSGHYPVPYFETRRW